LPVPVSPRINTVASPRAAMPMRLKTSRMAPLALTSSKSSTGPASGLAAASPPAMTLLSARSSVSTRAARATGLVR
jgi:hypothetical protein